MDPQRKSLRIGAAVIACAILLRLAGSGFFRPLADMLLQPGVASFLLYLETGRVARLSPPAENSTEVWVRESPAPELPPAELPAEPVSFTAEDLSLVDIRSSCVYEPDYEALLLQPLEWDLTGSDPTVLILHTHATESYTKTADADYVESSAYRTLDERYNMLAVGDALARQLEAGGLTVLHDRTLHDDDSYNGSYNHARASIEEYLAEYPSIRLILDLHRDAADLEDGGQLSTSATVDGRESARLMLVVGSDGSGLYHPHWQENLALALKLQVTLEKENPGICRYLCLRNSRYNQDERPGALLVEVGAAGDTLEKALTAAEVLGSGILALAQGTATSDSTS